MTEVNSEEWPPIIRIADLKNVESPTCCSTSFFFFNSTGVKYLVQYEKYVNRNKKSAN